MSGFGSSPVPSLQGSVISPSKFCASAEIAILGWAHAVGIGILDSQGLDVYAERLATSTEQGIELTIHNKRICELASSCKSLVDHLVDSSKVPKQQIKLPTDGRKDAIAASLSEFPIPDDSTTEDDPDGVGIKWDTLTLGFHQVWKAYQLNRKTEFLARRGIDTLYEIVFERYGLRDLAVSRGLSWRMEEPVAVIKVPSTYVGPKPSHEATVDGLLLAAVPVTHPLCRSISVVELDAAYSHLENFLRAGPNIPKGSYITHIVEYKLDDPKQCKWQMILGLVAAQAVFFSLGIHLVVVGVSINDFKARIYSSGWIDDDSGGCRFRLFEHSKVFDLSHASDYLLFHSFLCNLRRHVETELMPALEEAFAMETSVQDALNKNRTWKSNDTPSKKRPASSAPSGRFAPPAPPGQQQVLPADLFFAMLPEKADESDDGYDSCTELDNDTRASKEMNLKKWYDTLEPPEMDIDRTDVSVQTVV